MIRSMFKEGDYVVWNGERLEKGNGFVWRELYDQLDEFTLYKICQVIKEFDDFYYELISMYDNRQTPYFPEEVFCKNIKCILSDRYDLK